MLGGESGKEVMDAQQGLAWCRLLKCWGHWGSLLLGISVCHKMLHLYVPSCKLPNCKLLSNTCSGFHHTFNRQNAIKQFCRAGENPMHVVR